MGGLLEFIFGNLFFVLIVVAGLISAFSKNKEAQKKTQQQPQNRTPRPSPSKTQTSSPERERRPVREKTVQQTGKDKIGRSTTASIEAQQQAQMESLESRYGVSTEHRNTEDFSNHQFKSRDTLQTLEVMSNEQEMLKDDLKSNLKKKGFINGIIMAEVLGKPRALKKYRSPTMERYEK